MYGLVAFSTSLLIFFLFFFSPIFSLSSLTPLSISLCATSNSRVIFTTSNDVKSQHFPIFLHFPKCVWLLRKKTMHLSFFKFEVTGTFSLCSRDIVFLKRIDIFFKEKEAQIKRSSCPLMFLLNTREKNE